MEQQAGFKAFDKCTLQCVKAQAANAAVAAAKVLSAACKGSLSCLQWLSQLPAKALRQETLSAFPPVLVSPEVFIVLKCLCCAVVIQKILDGADGVVSVPQIV